MDKPLYWVHLLCVYYLLYAIVVHFLVLNFSSPNPVHQWLVQVLSQNSCNIDTIVENVCGGATRDESHTIGEFYNSVHTNLTLWFTL